jgi:hypothetical protein
MRPLDLARLHSLRERPGGMMFADLPHDPRAVLDADWSRHVLKANIRDPQSRRFLAKGVSVNERSRDP